MIDVDQTFGGYNVRKNYEYSRKRIAETTEEVRFASNRRRFLYIAGGIIVAVIFWIFSRKLQSMSPDEFRNSIFDWLFIAACVPIVGWAAANILAVLEAEPERKDKGKGC